MRRHRLPLCLAVWAVGLAGLATSASARRPCEDVGAVACVQWLEKLYSPAEIAGMGSEFVVTDKNAVGVYRAPVGHLNVDSASPDAFTAATGRVLALGDRGIYDKTFARPDSLATLPDVRRALTEAAAAVARANAKTLATQTKFYSNNNIFTATKPLTSTIAELVKTFDNNSVIISDMNCRLVGKLDGRCGGCRAVYIAVNSGDAGQTYQGPILRLRHSGEPGGSTFEYGQLCNWYGNVIQPGKAGGAMVGSKPYSARTGVEGTLVYDVWGLDSAPTGCSLHISFDSSASYFSKSFGENNAHWPKAELKGGDRCGRLRYEIAQVIPGDVGQMQLFIWYQSEWARFVPPEALGF